MPQADASIPYTLNDCMDVIRSKQGHYPVKTTAIAEALGLNVFRTSGWGAEQISGQLLKLAQNGGDSGYAIFVNHDHPLERRRFTIAHEIGHFVLHRDEIGAGIEDDNIYRSRLGAYADHQANLFAINEILIPESLFERAIGHAMAQCESVSIPVLAKMFEVPNSVMSIKMGVPYETDSQARPG